VQRVKSNDQPLFALRSDGGKLMIHLGRLIDLIHHPQHAVLDPSAVRQSGTSLQQSFSQSACALHHSKIPPFGLHAVLAHLPFLLCSDNEQLAAEAVNFGTKKGFHNPLIVTVFDASLRSRRSI